MQFTSYQIGSAKPVPFVSLEATSAAYAAMRERKGWTMRNAPQCAILDDQGQPVAHVSYNGRIWAGMPRDWRSDAAPLFCNR